MSDHFWSDKYPPNVPLDIDPDAYPNLMAVFDESIRKFGDKPAYSNFGVTITYNELDQLSSDFAAFIQHETNLKEGDRIALQMPNLIQYGIAIFGALKAGLTVVNTNPLYTEREMEHQFNDSGAKALVVLENLCDTVAKVLPRTPVETVIITRLFDMEAPLMRAVKNSAVKYVKKMVPDYEIPMSIRFTKALKKGRKYRPNIIKANPDDVAVLQYTGGTTGVAKGAMLTHRNLVANMLQIKAMLDPHLEEGREVMIAPLPMYHIYCFTVCCMCMMAVGAQVVLITNPRDIPGFVKELEQYKFTLFAGLNTLFVALCNNEDLRRLDFSQLKLTTSGGMALQHAVADEWKEVTGCEICECYGMTETSPGATVNPLEKIQIGTIGIPVPSTLLKVIDGEGKDIPLGSDQPGELCVQGPQVMKGYWQRPEETAKTMTDDGWLKTGDIAVIQPDGYAKIVDRAKDMIIVSGFNVYPNEVEDVVASHPDVLECAAIGVPDEKSGEAVKVFAVSKNASLTEEALRSFCKENLTGYKVPKYVEFRQELPKTNVGKILRRELRDEELKKSA